MKHDQDDKNDELLEEATGILDHSDAKTACALCEAASHEVLSPEVSAFMDAVSAIAYGRLIKLEGSEPIAMARDGVELPSVWSEVPWPTTFKDLDYVRQLLHRWAADIASERKRYFYRMIGTVAMVRAGRAKREMRELEKMTSPVRIVCYWEAEADALGLPR